MVHSFIIIGKDVNASFVAPSSRAASWAGGGWRGGGGDCGDLETPGSCPASRAPSALELGFGMPVQGNSSWPIAAMQLLTAIVGVGVLALPNAISWLGWLAGPLVLVTFYFVTLGSSLLLVDVYKAGGGTHQRYLDAVLDILGPRHAAVLVTCQMLALAIGCVGLMIAGMDALRMITHYTCQYAGTTESCIDKQWIMALLFGGLQVPLSQLPNLESIWLVSVMGAASSVGYCLIGLALGAFNAQGLGSLWGRSAPPFIKAMKVFEAIGDVSVAYFCAFVIFEIQATIKSKTPGGAANGMRKAIGIALTLASTLFISVGSAGYSALGAATPGSMLTAKFPGTPGWVPLVANVLIVMQMISSFQLHAQLLYANTEAACHALIACCTARARGGTAAAREAVVGAPIPGGGPRERAAVRAVVRTLLVVAATLIAVCIPSFSGVVGLMGGVLDWAVAVLYPTLMWVRARQPRRAVRAALIAANVVLLLAALAATIGSVFEIVISSQGGLLAVALKAHRKQAEHGAISISGH